VVDRQPNLVGIQKWKSTLKFNPQAQVFCGFENSEVGL
jgi:hypothetical protein